MSPHLDKMSILRTLYPKHTVKKLAALMGVNTRLASCWLYDAKRVPKARERELTEHLAAGLLSHMAVCHALYERVKHEEQRL
jgi:hypothetical protein